MEETQKKIDRRIIKTKKAIRGAFLDLLSEKEMEKITIKEIAERADVDRKTVYNYYAGVSEIRLDLENELVGRLELITQNLHYDVENPLAVFQAINDLVNENLEVYAQLMCLNSDSYHVGRLFLYLREKVRLVISRSNRVNPARVELATEYVTAGIFSTYRYWFHSDRQKPLETFTKEVGQMIIYGMPAYLESFEE